MGNGGADMAPFLALQEGPDGDPQAVGHFLCGEQRCGRGLRSKLGLDAKNHVQSVDELGPYDLDILFGDQTRF